LSSGENAETKPPPPMNHVASPVAHRTEPGEIRYRMVHLAISYCFLFCDFSFLFVNTN